jgi:hypothetical protein
MKKVLWVLALVLMVSSLFAGSLMADSSHAQQDQTFLSSLAQPAQAPTPPVLAAAPPDVLAPPASCVNLGCSKDSDCWPSCGGEGSSYCSHSFIRRCVPY